MACQCKTEVVMPACVTVVDELIAKHTKASDDPDATYWEELIKSIAAVIYEGQELYSPRPHSACSQST